MQCVSDSAAPEWTDSCQYGDYGGTITVNGVPLTCSQWITQGASCYNRTGQEDNAILCCETCQSFYNVSNLFDLTTTE